MSVARGKDRWSDLPGGEGEAGLDPLLTLARTCGVRWVPEPCRGRPRVSLAYLGIQRLLASFSGVELCKPSSPG